MHSALQWDNQDPFPLEEVQLESPYEILFSDYKVDKKAPTDKFPNKKSDHLYSIIKAQGSQVLEAVSVYDGKRTTKCKVLNDKADKKPNLAKKAHTSNVAPEYTL